MDSHPVRVGQAVNKENTKMPHQGGKVPGPGPHGRRAGGLGAGERRELPGGVRAGSQGLRGAPGWRTAGSTDTQGKSGEAEKASKAVSSSQSPPRGGTEGSPGPLFLESLQKQRPQPWGEMLLEDPDSVCFEVRPPGFARHDIGCGGRVEITSLPRCVPKPLGG